MNEPIYQSFIIKALISINDIICKKYLIYLGCGKKHEYFNVLNSVEQDIYIKHFEGFHYPISIISDLTKDLLISTKKLENIRILRDKKISEKGSCSEMLEYAEEETKYHTKVFYNAICILYLLSKEKILKSIEYKNFPEMYYIKLIRNNFLQHPSFENVLAPSSAMQIENSTLLPLYKIIGGAGYAFYTNYFANLVTDAGYIKLSSSEKLEKNKQDLIQAQGWDIINNKKDKNYNAQLVYRIKSDGLASVNQKNLADELLKLYEDIVFPFFEEKVKEAKKNKVCL